VAIRDENNFGKINRTPWGEGRQKCVKIRSK